MARFWRALGTLVGPGLLALSVLASGALATGMRVAGLLAAVGYFIHEEQARTTSVDDAAVARLTDVLETARSFLAASGSRDIRANLMVPTGPDQLQVRCKAGPYSPDETIAPWQVGVGCAGLAFQRKGTVLGARSEDELREARSRCTADVTFELLVPRPTIASERIASVMSVPISDAHGSVIAVLNFDDNLKLTDSALLTEKVILTVERLSHRLVPLLGAQH